MDYKLKIAFCLLTLFSFSCKSDTLAKAITEANTTVMTLHDETMARHGEIMNLAEELKKKAKDTVLLKGTLLDSIRTELDGLNEEMMDWMADFEEPETQDDLALNYLKEQAEMLTKLKASQLQNIEAAKNLLNK